MPILTDVNVQHAVPPVEGQRWSAAGVDGAKGVPSRSNRAERCPPRISGAPPSRPPAAAAPPPWLVVLAAAIVVMVLVIAVAHTTPPTRTQSAPGPVNEPNHWGRSR
jgi:hypothetical protein